MKKQGWFQFLLPITGLLFLAFHWSIDSVKTNNLLLDVPKVSHLPWLETPYAYFYLHLFTFIPVFLLSFDKNVHYYRKWKYLIPAIFPVALFFILWDVYFTNRGVWDFNHNYLSGIYSLKLPIEEWLFFFTVPFACVFVYECLNFYVKKDLLAGLSSWLTKGLIVLFFGIGIWKFWHMYTATTFILTGGFLLYHYLFEDGSYRSRFYFAYLVVWIPFFLVNGVLTGGYTNEPIVIYNPEEYFGLRITSIPIDDAVYNFLMLFWIITLFEKLRKR